MEGMQCNFCRHYIAPFRCAAFDVEIPDEIFTGEFDHSKPYPGDGGFRFEPADITPTGRNP